LTNDKVKQKKTRHNKSDLLHKQAIYEYIVFTLEPNFKVFKLFNSTKQNSKGLLESWTRTWTVGQQRTKTTKKKTKQQVLDSNTSWRLGLLLLDSTSPHGVQPM
jgi:hypothetical protein